MLNSKKWRKGKGDQENFGSVDKNQGRETHPKQEKELVNVRFKARSYYNKEKCVVNGTSLLVFLRNISTRTCSFKYQEQHADCQYCIIQPDITKDIMASV